MCVVVAVIASDVVFVVAVDAFYLYKIMYEINFLTSFKKPTTSQGDAAKPQKDIR